MFFFWNDLFLESVVYILFIIIIVSLIILNGIFYLLYLIEFNFIYWYCFRLRKVIDLMMIVVLLILFY